MYSPAFKYTAQVMQYEVNKYHYMHYLQWRPHRKFSISLAEGVMVNAPFELRFLNPFTIFHSYESYKTYVNYNEDMGYRRPPSGTRLEDMWDKNPDGSDMYDRTFDPNNHSRIGSYFGIKLEYQPVQNLRLYGLFAMNEFGLFLERDNWSDSLSPDAIALQAGSEFSIPVRGGHWEFGLEGVYTYPYMYVLWDKSWSFYKEYTELDVAQPRIRYWTGSPFGPDTIAGKLWGGFRSSERWYAGLSFEVSARGERSELTIFDRDNSINDTYRPGNYVYDVTVPPTGIPIYSYTLSFLGEYQYRQWLGFHARPGYRLLVNAGRIEGQREHSFEFALSMRFRPPVR